MKCEKGYKLDGGKCVQYCRDYPEAPFNETGYLYNYMPKSQVSICMRPEDFLYLAAPGIRQGNVDKLKKHVQSGGKLDPLFLDVDIATGNVVGHEGRHRAEMAKQLGMSCVPVILYHRESYDGRGYKNIENLYETDDLPMLPEYDTTNIRKQLKPEVRMGGNI